MPRSHTRNFWGAVRWWGHGISRTTPTHLCGKRATLQACEHARARTNTATHTYIGRTLESACLPLIRKALTCDEAVGAKAQLSNKFLLFATNSTRKQTERILCLMLVRQLLQLTSCQ